MAQSVEVTLELDSDGAVRKVESAAASFERLDQESEQAASSMEESASAAREQGDASERAAQGAREQAQAQEQVAASGRRMNSTVSASANDLGFELVQASQDAKFGMVGVANQIPLMSEQFSRLRQETGSTTGAFSALFSALKGPAGIIGAFTLLLTFKDEIVSFFTAAGDSAQEAKEKIDQMQEAAESLIEVDLGLETQDIENLDRARAFLDGIQERIEQIESLQDLDEMISTRDTEAVIDQLETVQELRAEGDGPALDELGDIGEIARELEQTSLTVQDLRERGADAIQDELDGREDALNVLKQQRDTLKQSIAGAEAMKSVFEEMPADLKEVENKLKDINALDPLEEPLAGGTRGQGVPEGGDIDPLSPDAPIGDVGRGQGTQRLVQKSEFSAAKNEIFQFNAELKRGIKLGDELSSGITNAFTNVAEAIGSGKSPLRAFAQSIGSLFQKLGTAIIVGSQALSALFSANPAIAIPAGAALIAAGTAIKGILADGPGGGGGGSTSTPTGGGSSPSVEGGGEITQRINAPGRGSRRAVSGDSTRAMSSGSQGGEKKVQVEVTAEGEMGADGSALARALRPELKRIDAETEELT